MADGRSLTLSQVARQLDAPQHRLIHFCERGIITPELGDARGRGSSRAFSERNLLEFAIALRLREMMVPVASIGAVLSVLREFEKQLHTELREFSLPDSLRNEKAPDLRIILSDGQALFFSLGRTAKNAKLFGGIPLDQTDGEGPDRGGSIPLAASGAPSGMKVPGKRGFGGPEGSRFVRLELSVTEIARALPLAGQ
jgi:DNA-binding transcriptional MerR regulator